MSAPRYHATPVLELGRDASAAQPTVPVVSAAEAPGPQWGARPSSRGASPAKALRVLILGADNLGIALQKEMEAKYRDKFALLGFLDPDHHQNPQMLGKTRDLPRILQTLPVDAVFVTLEDPCLLRRVLRQGTRFDSEVYFVGSGKEAIAGSHRQEFIGDAMVVPVLRKPTQKIGLALKRMIDIAGSIASLAVFLPLLPLIALAIKLDSRGPVFYCSKRVGKGGNFIPCYKFRTMVEEADAMRKSLSHLNEREGLLFKISDDPRTTRLGKYLRKFSVDELPQLWHVLVGDMSLVGPRPPLVSEYRKYDLEHLERLTVKPGLTGLWQVTERGNPSFTSYLNSDVRYVRSWSLWLDFKILLQTIPAILKGTGQ